MKILYIITKSEVGGAQKFVYEQISLLQSDTKYECFLCCNQNGWLADLVAQKTKKENIFFHEGIESFFSITFLFALIKFIRSKKIDLIVANSANAGMYGRFAGYIASIKSIYVSHGWSSIYNGGRLQIIFNSIERFLSFFSSIWCISESDKRKAIEIIKIPENKLTVISNSVLPPASSLKSSYMADFVAVTRLSPPKRVDILIEAMTYLPNYRLHIYGDGPQKNNLIALIEKKKISNVQLMGEVLSFSNYNNYKVFCLISDSEGLPISALEALSFGLPLVLSKVGGCIELIKENGCLVDNNPNEISQALDYCIANFDEFSNQSLNLFNKKFNLNNNIEEIKKYFEDTVKR